MSRRPIKDIASRFSERADAEHYRDRFRSGHRRWTHQCEEKALEAALSRIGGRVRTIVDVGSGAGRFIPVLRAHAARLFEVDTSPHMLMVSREDHPTPDGSVSYIQADARNLPLADDCADLVFCHRLLNHISDPEDRKKVLRHLRRISAKHVLISCLMAPGLLKALRQSIAFLRRRDSTGSAIEATTLLREATEVGLNLEARIPIRRFVAPCEFHILTKS